MGDYTCVDVYFSAMMSSPFVAHPQVVFASVESKDFLGTFPVNGHVGFAQFAIKFVHVVLGVKGSRLKSRADSICLK